MRNNENLSEESSTTELFRKYKKFIIGGIVIILFLIINPFKSIPEGTRGLKFTFGKIDADVLHPGIHVYLPFVQTINILKVIPMVIEKKIEVGTGGAISKDNQTIGAEIKVFYKYQINNLIEMWSKYGPDRTTELVAAAVTESFKVVIGEYNIFALPVSQEEIRAKVIKNIKAKMSEYPVDITDLNVLNYDWSDDFDKQIAETMQRAQQVKQKEQELLITEQESQKLVKQAQAEKEALITKAEGEKEAKKLQAEAKALEGEGIRRYNESVQKNMQLEMEIRRLEIEKIKATKWNGQYVPNNMYGPIPVDTVGGIKK